MNKNIIIIITTLVLTIISLFVFKKINDKKFYEIYEVSFNTYGGSIIETQYIKRNEKVKRPKNPVLKDNEFVEWTYLGKRYDFNTKVNKKMTLKAKYKNNNNIKKDDNYIIRFDSNNGSIINNQIVKENSTGVIPENPIREGYKFIGWYLNDKIYDFNELVTSDINLIAKWEKEDKQYKVIFNSNGGNKINNITLNENDDIIRPKDPVKEGYKFIGWYYNNKLFNFNNKIKNNITLIARWEKIKIKPEEPIKPEEQEENKEENKPVDKEEQIPEEKPILKKYKIIFNSDGGSNIESIEIEEGNKIKEPNKPVKEGYEFNGWLLNGNKFDFNTIINKDITLEASWIIKVYKVKKEIKEDNIILKVYLDNKIINYKQIKDTKGNILSTGENNIITKEQILPNTVNIILLDGKTVTGIIE